MNRVLISQVRHPLELFKSCQVRKLDLSEIRHLNGMDILNLAFGIGTLISCSLLMSVKIIIKGGWRRGLLWLLWWCVRWLQGFRRFAPFQILKPRSFWWEISSQRHWESKTNFMPKIYARYASEGFLRTFVEHFTHEKN